MAKITITIRSVRKFLSRAPAPREKIKFIFDVHTIRNMEWNKMCAKDTTNWLISCMAIEWVNEAPAASA